MKTLILSRGKETVLDDEDYERVKQWKWSYASTGYAVRNDKGTIVYLHRYIVGAKKGQLVDHMNMDTLDNRRLNLRFVTKSQNMMNRKAPVTNTSGYKGVSWHKGASKWMVYLAAESEVKRIYLGLFKSLKEAVKAWNTAAQLYHGEHARLQTYKREKKQ